MRKALLAALIVSFLLIPGFNAVENTSVEKKDDFVKLGDGCYSDMIDRSMLNLFNGRQTILQFILSSLFMNFRDSFMPRMKHSNPTESNGGIDQSQEDISGGYAEIYGNRWFAQSFVPKTYMQLTGIEIFVEREGLRALSTGINANLLDLNSDMIVEIADSLNGTMIARKNIPGSEISKSMRWLSVDFTDKNVIMELGQEYFIRISQTGGDERHYYKWYYGTGDTYSDGKPYSKESGADWQELSDDFAFHTLGEYTGDEPDGIVDKWAVVVGTRRTPDQEEIYADEDAVDVDNLLKLNGWKTTLLIDEGAYTIKDAIAVMKENEDADDVVLFYMSGHGGSLDDDLDGIYDESVIFCMYSGSLGARDLDNIFDEFASQKIIFIFDACNSGGFISYKYNLKQEGRLIMASSAQDEVSYGSHSLKNGYFTYYLVEGLGISGLDDDSSGEPGYREISAEEVYPYVYNKISYKEHPQFWSGIDGEVGLTEY